MIRVFIVDDEAPARRRLRRLLEPLEAAGRVTVAGEATDGVEAVQALGRTEADLVLLDIRMPGLDGFEVLERLDPARRPVVVFTTAFDEYAVRAFEANAVDYLLKPISRERLEASVERVERMRPARGPELDERLSRLLDWVDARAAEASTAGAGAMPDSVPVRQISIAYRDRILLVPVEQIVSAEINDGITRLFAIEEAPGAARPRVRPHIVAYTLDQLAAMFDPDEFMRVHRAAIVRFEHVRELIPWFSGRFKLVLTGGHEVIASRERSKAIKERLSL